MATRNERKTVNKKKESAKAPAKKLGRPSTKTTLKKKK